MPGKSHGQRSLAGYSPKGHKKSDITEQLSMLTHTHTHTHTQATEMNSQRNRDLEILAGKGGGM